ncbi:hypothetical protein C7M84_006922 [Penaeus vannamei]|uniref:Uncharacterized protein n=1 Tax=Penaeus vannamei TaxID=6689 RepID=A0A3R7STP8_PENVA|nr:uncharacterized protein LOC113808133 [Penaeus vannamei]ROT74587.1 hypothetical protein C7M84_006922 [Penaeus vannamei]
MYGLVHDLHKGQVPTKKHPAKKQKKEPAEPCCRRLGRSLKRFVLRLRAAVLVLTAFLGIPAFYMTLHFLLDPGLATLAARFEPALCLVSSATALEGKNNCTWSSCRQGCTVQEMFHCWRIFVHVYEENASYVGPSLDENTTAPPQTASGVPKPTLLHPEASAETPDAEADRGSKTFSERSGKQGLRTTRLLSSVKGCGYQSCETWAAQYASLGTTFACNVSSDRTFAVTDANHAEAVVQVVLGVLPLILTVASLLLMYLLYWRKGAHDRTLKLSLNPESRRAKWEQARVEILKNMASEKEASPLELGLAFSSGVKTNLKSLKNLAGEVHRVWKTNEKKKGNVGEGNDQAKKDWAEEWRIFAAKASVHPTVSPARHFNQVTINISNKAQMPLND